MPFHFAKDLGESCSAARKEIEESCIRRADAHDGLQQAGAGPSDTIPLN